ncbi:MAG TPA: prolyl oligopeptidase family serine peptidase [Sedimentisphaerales bacterium]|nr:prolyl oligopeptidase family serine peptidase [Sedimentisphaerales bacterium]
MAISEKLLVVLVIFVSWFGVGMNDKILAGQAEKSLARVVETKVEGKYLLYLPAGYEKVSEKKWPLVMFLHGAGERGDDINLVKIHGPAEMVEKGKEFPFILVSPQCPAGKWWTESEQLLFLKVLLDDVIAEYNVDESRVYLTGLSMGGFGTWALAIEQPERFAAIAPICGGGMKFLAYRLKNVPTWVFHGEDDDIVPLSYSQGMVDALKLAGGDVRFTVYPKTGHDSWRKAYADEELYEWLLSHRRK